MIVRTAFSTLGLDETASVEAIRDAYRDLVKVWHPDRFPGDPGLQTRAGDMMRAINVACDIALAHATTPRPSPGAPGGATTTATAATSATTARRGAKARGEPGLFFFRATLISGLGLLLLAMMAPRSPVRAGTALGLLDRVPAKAGTYAPTASELGSLLEGTWLLEGWLFDFRQGAIFVRGETMPVAHYAPDTNQTLVYREGENGDRVVYEIEFTPTTMQWYAGRGAERRLVHEFRRCCAL